MIEPIVELTEGGCNICGNGFDGNTVFCSSDGAFYCRECAKGIDEESVYPYLIHEGMAKLKLGKAAFEELSDGLYEVVCVDDELIINLTFRNNQEKTPFLTIHDSNVFIMEKRESGVAINFPCNIVSDMYDFVESPKKYKSIENDMRQFTGSTAIEYIKTDSDKIVGLMFVLNDKALQTVQNWPFYSQYIAGSTLCGMSELRKLYRNPPYYRSIAKGFQRITPATMLDFFSERLKGQNAELQKLVYLFYKYLEKAAAGESFTADSFILTAPSGAGKTEVYRILRAFCEKYAIPVPIVQIDLSQITEAGYKGDNVSSIPLRIFAENNNSKGIGICFLDEADKKCVPSYSKDSVNINAAVQSNLLTLIEGKRIKGNSDDEIKDFNSGETMFVVMGAFQEVRNQKKSKRESEKKRGLGFDFPCESAPSDMPYDKFHEDLTLQEMIDYGMIEELAGRMVQVINLHRLSEKDMRELIKCKVKTISADMGVEIDITDCAIEEFLTISFGKLGVREPMNKIKELAFAKAAEATFNGGFSPHRDIIVIDSLSSARIARRRADENEG